MEKMDVLRDLSFGQRVAEEEGGALADYFVETNHWLRLYADEIDVVYGPKGAGKSALYMLLNTKTTELFDRGVILIPGENPRGAPAFQHLTTDPPVSEREFVALWKLYFVCLLSGSFEDYGVKSASGDEVRELLEREGLVRGKLTLQGLLRLVFDYAKAAVRSAAFEGSVQIDPHSGLPTGFTGKISFNEPDAVAAKEGVISVDELLRKCNENLETSEYSIWLTLDRLDVAFTDTPGLEQSALRALFKVYLDLMAYERIRLKIFLRSDIWRRITEEGFREASHITRHMTIDWNKGALLNVIVRRAAQNNMLLKYYEKSKDAALISAKSQELLFYQMCPNQVELGTRKSSTLDWMLSRTKDGSKSNAPRELIHLLNCVRDEQIRHMEIGDPEPENGQLFARGTFKEALPEVSRTRLEQTLYAEYPDMQPYLEKLREQRTAHSASSLADIWMTGEDIALTQARALVEVGFFEERGSRDDPEFWIPFLYRDALQLIQGAAD